MMPDETSWEDGGWRGSATVRLRDAVVGAFVAVAILVANSAFVSARFGFLHKPHRVLETDHHHYLAMARGAKGDPELALRQPYCWRVLVPWAAGLLHRTGLSLNAAFFLITNLSLFGFLLALYLLLAARGLPHDLRILGLVLVGLMQGAVRWFEYQYWMTDPTALMLTTVAFLAIEKRHDQWLWMTSVVAAFVRETYVLVYPYYVLRLLQRERLSSALRRTFALGAVPFLVTLALRHWVPANPHDGLIASIVDNLGFRLRHIFDNGLYLLTIGTWGVLLPLALLRPNHVWTACRRNLDQVAFVGLVYLTTVLISNNNERPLAYALPVMLPVALTNLVFAMERLRLARGAIFTLVAMLQLLFYLRTRFAGQGISIYQPVSWSVTVSLALFWLGGLWLLYARRPTGA
jgi:hypothetical protein